MKKYDSTAIAIIAAKENSNRFPGKNIYEINGKPMFFHSVEPFLNSKHVSDIYVTTNSHYINNYLKDFPVEVIWRNKNAIHDDEPLLSVLKTAYMQLNISAQYICTIMANCPGHTSETIDKAINLVQKLSLHEVRSFNSNGDESGIIVLKERVVLSAPAISSYIGSIYSDIDEIHYKKDLK